MPKISVKGSSIHWRGVFAEEDIQPDEFIIEYTGERIDSEEANKRELENDRRKVTYIFELDEDNYIDGAFGGNISKYINHSCDPNCKIERIDGKVMIYSARKINAGEELAYDYGYDKECEKEICNCNSKNCRGFINEE